MATFLMPLDQLRVLLSTAMLLYASLMDLRTREVSNWTWVVFAPMGLLFNLYEGLYLGVVNPLMGILLPVIISTSLSLTFFYLGLYGGADAKAFIILSFLIPYPPKVVALGLGVISPLYPLTIFTNSALIAVLFALSLLVRNLYWVLRRPRNLFMGLEGEVLWKKGLAFLSCMKVEVKSLRGPPYQYPAEVVEDSRRRLQLLPDAYDDEAAKATFRILTEDMGLGEVWVSPTLPFLLFISVGFFCSLLLGDIALWALEMVL